MDSPQLWKLIPHPRYLCFDPQDSKKKESEISEIVNFAKRRTTSKTGKEKLAAAKISKKTIMTG